MTTLERRLGVVAFCNATSSARLAARHPESGGTYVYGRELPDRGRNVLAALGLVSVITETSP